MKLHYDISAWDIFGAAASMVIARLLAKVDFPEAYAISCGPGAVGLVRRTGVALDRAKPAQIWQKIDPAHRSALEPLFPAEALARERREPVDRSEGSRPRRPSSHWRRGIERRLIFRDDADRDDFIDRFGAVLDDTTPPLFCMDIDSKSFPFGDKLGPGQASLQRICKKRD